MPRLRKGCSVWPDYKYRYFSLPLSLSLSRTASSSPRVCHRVLRRSLLHRIPRVSRICPLQANHLRPRCRRPKATLRRSIQAYRIPQSATGTPYLSRIKVQIRARLNRQGAYLPTYSIAVHTSTTFTGMSMFMSCHAISYFSWPPRAQKCNYSCICIPASPISVPQTFVYLPFSLHCFSS